MKALTRFVQTAKVHVAVELSRRGPPPRSRRGDAGRPKADWLYTCPRRRAAGRLLRAEMGSDVPLSGVAVELLEVRHVGADVPLASGHADDEGRFVLDYAPTHDAAATGELRLRVFDERPAFDRDGAPRLERDVLLHQAIFAGEESGGQIDLGTIRIPFWEYAARAPTPRAATSRFQAAQRFHPATERAIADAVARVSGTRLRHLAINAALPDRPRPDAIAADYPESRTRRMNARAPGSAASDAYLVDRLLNGIGPAIPAREGESLAIGFSWEDIAVDGRHFAPNTVAHLDSTGAALDRIEVRRRPRGGGAPGPVEVIRPADGPRWEAAKRMCRVNAALFGQIEEHLGRAHLNVEQYAIAARRALRRSPLRWLLGPHLREVSAINFNASRTLLGDRGFLVEGSALTPASAEEVLARALGTCDWAGWAPRRPLGPHHRYARAAAIYWQILDEHVTSFLAAHAEAIRASWDEVLAFSNELVGRSVAHRADPARDRWYDDRERGTDARRMERDGVRRAVSAITTSAAPTAEDLARLAELSRYVIFHATFFHTWSNDAQWDDGGDPLHASLGLDADLLADPGAVGVSPYEATTQLYFAHYLTHMDRGFVLRDEDGDIHPRLAALVAARRIELAPLGLDVDRLRSRINI
jgi:hypothetical protein